MRDLEVVIGLISKDEENSKKIKAENETSTELIEKKRRNANSVKERTRRNVFLD